MTRFPAVVIALWLAPAWGQPPEWRLVPGESTLGFTARYEGEPFGGGLDRFDVRFRFYPGDLDATLLEVTIDTTSVNTRNRDRDDALSEAEWFDFDNHPEASYAGQTASAGNEREYRIEGVLTLKGIRGEVPIEFDWEVDGDQAHLKGTARMRGDTLINRLDFDIGTGEWADPLIGHEVDVHFDLRLTR